MAYRGGTFRAGNNMQSSLWKQMVKHEDTAKFSHQINTGDSPARKFFQSRYENQVDEAVFRASTCEPQ
jgi:hypothetical protein